MTDLSTFRSYPDDNPASTADKSLFSTYALLGPQRFDWRDGGALTFRVRDQGGWNCCSSFAYTAMIEARLQRAGLGRGRLSASFPHFCLAGAVNPADPRSPGRIGGLVAGAGMAAGASDPLPPTAQQCAGWRAAAFAVPEGDYVPVQKEGTLNLLVNEGPMVVDMAVPRDFGALKAHDIYRPEPAENDILHAMLLIGYDYPNRTVTLLNSMGPGWGNLGYVTVAIGTGKLLLRYPYRVVVS